MSGGAPPPRIGYLTGQYPRPTDTFIQREVAALRRRGHVVATFAARRGAEVPAPGDALAEERAATTYLSEQPLPAVAAAVGAAVLRSPGRFGRALRLALATRAPGARALVYQLFYLVEACVLAREMRRRRLGHLHNHFGDSSCSIAMLAAEVGGFPFSFTLHGPAIFFEPLRWRLDAKLERARFVACISHFCRSQAMIFCPPACWPRLHVVHCGVEPGRYGLRAHDGPGRRLLYVGRLAAAKGLPVLIEAAGRLRAEGVAFVLDVVGDGPDRAGLEDEVRRRGLDGRVVFHGYLPEAAVGRRLAETDVFVLPSFAEGVPVVLMEAMAAGVPVVATRIAGIPELVEDGVGGYLVPPGDPAALVGRVRALIDDPALRRRMGRAARRRVERDFDVGREAAALGRLLAGERPPLRPADARGAAAADGG